MKIIKYLIWLLYPVFFIALFASLLTTKPYMRFSEGLYASHENITFDYDYVTGKLIDYLNYRSDDLHFGANPEDDTPILRHETRIENGEEVLISEIEHMKDVRTVYTQVRIAGLVSLGLVIMFSGFLWKKDRKLLSETYRDIYLFPLFFILFVGGWFIVDFHHAFTIFHEIFFEGNWQFSVNDTLILLLPQMFWFVSGVIILFLLGITIGTTMLLSRYYLSKTIDTEEVGS